MANSSEMKEVENLFIKIECRKFLSAMWTPQPTLAEVFDPFV